MAEGVETGEGEVGRGRGSHEIQKMMPFEMMRSSSRRRWWWWYK